MILLLPVVVDVEVGPESATRPVVVRRKGLTVHGLPLHREAARRDVPTREVADDVIQVVVEVRVVLLTTGDVATDGGTVPGPEGVRTVPVRLVVDIDPGPESATARVVPVPTLGRGPTHSLTWYRVR